jgi:predicted RND superfamily exporter protein
MPSLWSSLLRHSAWTICLTAILTLVCLFTIRKLQFDTSPSTLILTGSSEARYYEEIKRIFGNDQLILIGIQGDNLLQPSELARVRDLTNELEQISGVKRVLSLTSVKDVRGAGEEVLVSPLIPEDDSQINLQALRDRIRNNPFYVKNLISADERTLAILVFLDEFEQRESLLQGREVTRQVRAITHRVLGEGRAFVSGLPEMELQGTENMIRDLRVLTPLTLVLVTLVLAVSFRCLRGIVLPLGMIALAVVWTLGVMVWSGRPLKVTTMILPSLLISNGTSYVIHFLAQYYRLLHKAYAAWGEQPDSRLDRHAYRQALLDAVEYTHSPIFISAATTMAGFGAFIFSGIPAIRDLGIFATLGVFLSYWFCVLLVPSFLWFSPVPRFSQLPGGEDSHRHTILEALARFNLHRAGWVYGVSLVSAAWALWGLLHVQVHTDYLSYFHKDASVVQTARFFHERMAGIAPLFVVVEAKGERKVTEPDVLRATDALQRGVQEIHGVDAALSFVDTLKLLNRAFHDEAAESFVVPEEPEVIASLIDFAESDPSGLSADFLSSDHRYARIVARTHLFSSSELHTTIDRINEKAAQVFPPDFKVQVSGSLVLMNQTSDRVAAEQAKSLIFSVLLISAIVVILFRSFKIACLAMIPAGLPVFLCFGLMGWSGVSLNVNTSLIANVAIGIAVNNCVHFLVHFQRNVRNGLSTAEATRESLKNAGAAMLAASIALTLGFLVFGLSKFVPVSQFGLLTAFIMGTDLLANIFLLPSLMRFCRGSEGGA